MKKFLSLFCLLSFAITLHAKDLAHAHRNAGGKKEALISVNASLTTAPFYVPLAGITIANSVTSVAFTACAGNTLSLASFTVSGAQLSSTLVVTADAGFAVATSTGGNFTSSINLEPSSGTVAATVIYVRANAGSSSGTTGNIVCSSSGVLSKTIAGTVTVYALPVFSVNPTSSAASYCQNGTASALVVNFAPGSGNQASYRWYSNSAASNTGGTGIGVSATSISGASALTQTYTPPTTSAGTTYYYAVATNSYGCSAASSVSGAVTINAKPAVVTLTSLNSSNGINICTGSKANLTADSVTAGSTAGLAFTYAKDYLFTNFIADSTSVSSGSYYIKGTDGQGCSSNAVLIRVIQKSNPAISSAVVVDNECDFENKGSITLNLSATGTAPFSYVWTKSGDSSFRSTSQNLTGLTIGTYNLSMVDAYGCTAKFTTPVSAQDYTNPVEPVLPDIEGQCSVTVTAPTTTDNCSGIVTGIQENYTYDNDQKTTITFTGQGTYYIDWIFVDDWGNTSFATQKVVVADVTAPVAPVLPDLSGECSVTATIPTAEDNCSGTITGTTADPLTYTTPGTYVINWIFDDGNGNITNATQNVTVTDVTAPVAPVLQDVVVECSVDYTIAAPTAEDACSGTIAGTTTDPLVYSKQGTYLINWTFDDGHGNVSYATQKIIVKDTTAPVTPVLPDVVETCSATVTAPTTTDNCSGTITGTTSDPLSYSAKGTYTITWTFDDGNGNSTTTTQKVIINDSTAPVAPVLADIVEVCNATVTAPTTTDNCAGTITGTTTDPVSYTEQGTYTITWTFADGNGNSVTATQLVIISDTVKPTITAPANISAAAYRGACDGSGVSLGTPVTADNCGVATVTNDAPATFPEGTTTVTWTVTDIHGNTATATQTVTRPTALSASAVATNALCAGGYGSVALTVTGGTAAYSYSWSNGDTTQHLRNVVAGTYSVTVTDANGCTASASATVTQPARINVSISGPGSVCAGSTGNFSAAGGVSYVWSGPNGFTSTLQSPTVTNMQSANTGIYTVVVTDANGCSNTANTVVTVKSCSGIYPTEVSCSDFNAGSAYKLASICVTTKTAGSKTTVSNATPGVFFYYTNIVAPASSFSVYVSQTASSALGVNFSLSQGYAFAFANGCTKVATGAAAGTNGDALINVKGVKAGSVITIAVKYDSKSIVGKTVTGSLPSVSNFVCRLGTSITSPVIENTATSISIANCSGTVVAAPTVSTAVSSAIKTGEQQVTAETPAVQVKAYPNPFVDRVSFTLRSAVSGNAMLELYDISGRKIAVPFTGTMQAGVAHTLSYTVPSGINGMLIYRFRVGGKTVEGKLVSLR